MLFRIRGECIKGICIKEACIMKAYAYERMYWKIVEETYE